MSWQKFTDRARENRKVRKASTDRAIVLWWAVGNWCCENKTDGFISKEDVPDAWRPIGRKFDHSAAAKECAEAKLFIDHGDVYEVKDFLEFNPSKDQDDGRKANDAKRAAQYRARQKALKANGITRDGDRDGMRDEARDDTRDSPVTSRERHAEGVTTDPSDARHAPLDPLRPDPLRDERGESALARPPSSAPQPTTSSQQQTLQDTIATEACRMGFSRTPKASRQQYADAIQGALEIQKSSKLQWFDDACTVLARAALQQHRDTGKAFGFVLAEIDPLRPAGSGASTADDAEQARRYPTINSKAITSWK